MYNIPSSTIHWRNIGPYIEPILRQWIVLLRIIHIIIYSII